MKNYLRIAIALLAVVMCVSFVGCAQKSTGRAEFDIDISTMTQAAAHAQLCSISKFPDAFVGHKLTMTGTVSRSVDDHGNKVYFCGIA